MNTSFNWIALVTAVLVSFTLCRPVSGDDDQKLDLETVTAVADSPSKLSVAPLDHVDYPLDRPTWIEEHRVPVTPQNGEDLLISVSSGPAASPEIAAEMMEVMARGAVENYLEQMAQDGAEPVPVDRIEVASNWLREELISRRYDGSVGSSDEVRYESACLLRISGEEQQKLADSIQNYRLQGRLSNLGVIAVLGFAGLLSGAVGLGWLASRQQPQNRGERVG